MSATIDPDALRAAPPPENLWLNLLFNAVLPAFLLSWASDEKRLGTVWGLVVALSLPLGYGVWDVLARRNLSLIAVLGFVSILFTGGFGLLKVGGLWFAVKEATLPSILGLAIPISLRTRQPLVRVLLYNEQVLDTRRVQTALRARGNEAAFADLLVWASWMLAFAMFVSAAANFSLAVWLLPAQAGTSEFNRQLAKLQLWSWPCTMVPSTAMIFYALFRVLREVERLSGLTGPELFHHRRPRPALKRPAEDGAPPDAPV